MRWSHNQEFNLMNWDQSHVTTGAENPEEKIYLGNGYGWMILVKNMEEELGTLILKDGPEKLIHKEVKTGQKEFF